MEIAGFTIGVAGLAGLFSACLDAIDHVDSYRRYGVESRYLTAQLNADKVLFKKWADEVGVVDGKVNIVNRTDLDRAEVVAAVERILSSIHELFVDTDKTLSKLQSENSNENLALPQNGYQSNPRKPKLLQVGKGDKVMWALRGKSKFTTQAEVFKTLVEKLYSLIPLKDQSRNLKFHGSRQLEGLENPLNDDSNESSEWFSESRRGLREMQVFLEGESRKEISGWLDATLTNRSYDTCLSRRVTGTCDWILSNPVYLTWASLDFPSTEAKILWICGPAGYGKSTICARLIEVSLVKSASSLAYFFCSSEVDAQKEPLAIIKSWIQQAVYNNRNAFDLILDKMRLQNGKSASTTDIWDAFRSIVCDNSDYMFVVDGLDECFRGDRHTSLGENTAREDFLIKLKSSVANTPCRVLIVSREEVDIRNQMLRGSPGQKTYVHRLCQDDVQPDVMRLSKCVVDMKLPNKNESLRDDLAGQLAAKCDGMFLWIRLQGNRLHGGINRKRLQEVVNDMPIGLERAYARDWHAIMDLPTFERHRAEQLLCWTIFATRPLTVLELTEALIVRDDDVCDDLLVDDFPDDVDQEYVNHGLLDLCGSLIEARGTNSEDSLGLAIVHLVHFSVKQFLLSLVSANNSLLFDEDLQNNNLAKICLRYLNYEHTWLMPDPSEGQLHCHPFLDYAVRSWPLHLRPAGSNYHEVVDLADRLFRPGNPKWSGWRTHFESSSSNSSTEGSTKKAPGNLLYYATLFGLVDTMKTLLDQYELNPNEVGGQYGTAMQAACAEGHTLAFNLLVDKGASLDIQAGDYGSAINAAIVKRHDHIAKCLVDMGANLSVTDPMGRTPLYQAAKEGSVVMLKLLLEKGANVAVPNDYGWTPLNSAADSGHFEVVKLLLEKGADMTVANDNGWTPLNSAASSGHVEVVRLLLEKGANIRVANNNGWTPLNSAADSGHIKAVKLLLEKGADITVANDNGWTPLNSAASSGHVEVVKLLLEKGADITIANNNGATPLNLAAYGGHVEVVKLLLEKGADITIASSDGWTPLNLTADYGHVEVVKLLLEKGADITIASSDGWTPLNLAANNGHVEVVKLLLENGADMTVAYDNGWTPLKSAAGNGHVEVVKLLLEKGADMTVANDNGWTPLNSAASSGHVEVVKLLLEKGADITIASSNGWTPLNSAADNGHVEVVKLLLEKGADMTVVNDNGWTPLNSAANSGHVEVVKLLLEKGADITVVNNTGETPLHSAASNGHTGCLKILLDSGSDVDACTLFQITALHSAFIDTTENPRFYLFLKVPRRLYMTVMVEQPLTGQSLQSTHHST